MIFRGRQQFTQPAVRPSWEVGQDIPQPDKRPLTRSVWQFSIKTQQVASRYSADNEHSAPMGRASPLSGSCWLAWPEPTCILSAMYIPHPAKTALYRR